MTPEEIDQHLDAVLRASGSALRNYTLEKSKADMRAAVQAIIAQARADERRKVLEQCANICDENIDPQEAAYEIRALIDKEPTK